MTTWAAWRASRQKRSVQYGGLSNCHGNSRSKGASAMRALDLTETLPHSAFLLLRCFWSEDYGCALRTSSWRFAWQWPSHSVKAQSHRGLLRSSAPFVSSLQSTGSDARPACRRSRRPQLGKLEVALAGTKGSQVSEFNGPIVQVASRRSLTSVLRHQHL